MTKKNFQLRAVVLILIGTALVAIMVSLFVDRVDEAEEAMSNTTALAPSTSGGGTAPTVQPVDPLTGETLPPLTIQTMVAAGIEERGESVCGILDLNEYTASRDTAHRRYLWLIAHDSNFSCVIQKSPVTVFQEDGVLDKLTSSRGFYDRVSGAWVYEVSYSE